MGHLFSLNLLKISLPHIAKTPHSTLVLERVVVKMWQLSKINVDVPAA
jgi:hypothetical protein